MQSPRYKGSRSSLPEAAERKFQKICLDPASKDLSFKIICNLVEEDCRRLGLPASLGTPGSTIRRRCQQRQKTLLQHILSPKKALNRLPRTTETSRTTETPRTLPITPSRYQTPDQKLSSRTSRKVKMSNQQNPYVIDLLNPWDQDGKIFVAVIPSVKVGTKQMSKFGTWNVVADVNDFESKSLYSLELISSQDGVDLQSPTIPGALFKNATKAMHEKEPGTMTNGGEFKAECQDHYNAHSIIYTTLKDHPEYQKKTRRYMMPDNMELSNEYFSPKAKKSGDDFTVDAELVMAANPFEITIYDEDNPGEKMLASDVQLIAYAQWDIVLAETVQKVEVTKKKAKHSDVSSAMSRLCILGRGGD
jgi:hypothetical protein